MTPPYSTQLLLGLSKLATPFTYNGSLNEMIDRK